MTKKIIAVLMACTLLLLSGCGKSTSSDGTSPNQSGADSSNTVCELQLLYCANDTVNPYKVVSKLNSELATLIFDPLVKVNSSFEAIPVLASNISYKELVCTVTLNDVVFSDDTPLTSDDVLFSYKLAKESSLFSYLFYEVEKVEAIDGRTVNFHLTRYDPYFAKLLTFPILKSGSDNLKNEDNVELPPIGTGPFIFSDDKSELIHNPSYREAVSVERIKLINAPDGESVEHYVEIGASDIYYVGASDDKIIRMSGQKASVNLNNLVYIGINHEYELLKASELRYAISSALSRSEIVANGFYNNAVAATGFYHPDWAEVSGYQTIPSQANLKISVENLANIGYNRLNADGYYENSAGNIVELSLLVNSDNQSKVNISQLIVKQLKSAGIKINTVSLSGDDYLKALEAGEFQLYLGEVKFLPNMDISSLLLYGGSAAYGITDPKKTSSDEQSEEAPTEPTFNSEFSYMAVMEGLYNGTNNVVDVASALLTSMPVIPVAYRSSVIFYSNEIESIVEASCYDIFLSINEYIFKK